MKKIVFASVLSIFICTLFMTSALQAQSTFPNTTEGAKQLLEQFLKPGADYKTLTNSLRPTQADFDAFFKETAVQKAYQGYQPPWNAGAIVVKNNPGQTAVILTAATTDELKTATGNASAFPGGYAQVAPHLKSGVTVYRFKFVKPGETLGMAYDGLVYLNNHWVIFPKSWRVLK
ncbi:hypothetical protein KJ708_09805 [bacterium]|nr:hypothetical protein [bacterium]